MTFARSPARASSATVRVELARPCSSDHRRVARQVEAGEREVEPRGRHRGLEVDRIEPHVPHLEQDRCAHRHGPRHRAPVTAAGREIVGVDLDVLRIPRARLGQGPVLERDGALRDDEAIHGDVERRGRSRPELEIRSEMLKPSANRTMRTVEPSSVASRIQRCPRKRERGRTRTSRQVEVGERGLAVRLPEAEPADDQPSGEWIERGGIDADGAAE